MLAAAFGVQSESAARAVPEGVAQVIAGPVADSALGLVEQRSRRADAGLRLVGDTAAGEHVDHLGCGGRSWGLEASDTRCDGLPLPGRRDGAGCREPDGHAAGRGGCLGLVWLSSSTDSPSRTARVATTPAGNL